MNIFYFELEPLAARYTKQLCEEWMPAAFEDADHHALLVRLISREPTGGEIKKGCVLDATGRGITCMDQCQQMLTLIGQGAVRNEDVIFLQDFWTPGIEAVFYALHLYGLKPRCYAMLHAQSVDEYDFTYPMRKWMRPMELGIAAHMDGIFVASTIHKEQLRAAGFDCPIHVVGLPIDVSEVRTQMPDFPKRNQVVFSSRLDAEKNPLFMLEVAKRFLAEYHAWEWIVTTSANEFRSNSQGALQSLKAFARQQQRFKMVPALPKGDYYRILSESKIQFNSSLQDYVSWTLLEASIAGCDLCYPNFRSFPECVPPQCRYRAFDADDAMRLLRQEVMEQHTHRAIADRCDLGRHMEAAVIIKGWTGLDLNVWTMP